MENFVVRADRVERAPYIKQVIEQGGTKATFSWTRGSGMSVTDNFPDENAVDALLLTARMFVQNNDPVSIGNMAKLKDDPGVSVEWKDRFDDTRTRLNTELDSPSLIREESGKVYTTREVFNIFLYGGLAHTDAKLAPIYNQWKGQPHLETEFHRAIIALSDAIYQINLFTKMEIAGAKIRPFDA